MKKLKPLLRKKIKIKLRNEVITRQKFKLNDNNNNNRKKKKDNNKIGIYKKK